MAGRAYLYALGARGERGVDRVLERFRADFARTMTLLGVGTVAELEREPLRSRNASAAAARCGRLRP